VRQKSSRHLDDKEQPPTERQRSTVPSRRLMVLVLLLCLEYTSRNIISRRWPRRRVVDSSWRLAAINRRAQARRFSLWRSLPTENSVEGSRKATTIHYCVPPSGASVSLPLSFRAAREVNHLQSCLLLRCLCVRSISCQLAAPWVEPSSVLGPWSSEFTFTVLFY